MSQPCLYVVATPIGNLADITQRAIDVLNEVDIIAAEDTRHSSGLLKHYGINTRLLSLHDFNESERAPQLVEYLQSGKSIALISDAGTPLISDPGYVVVNAARDAGFSVQAVPGASAVIAALSVAGLPTQAFYFAGFAPAKSKARQDFFAQAKLSSATFVFYESPHRIVESVHDLCTVLGKQHEIAIAKELTKQYERVLRGSCSDIHASLQSHAELQRGEFVVMVRGCAVDASTTVEVDRHLELLLSELPLKRAVAIVAELTGERRNHVYQRALEINKKNAE